MKKIGILTLPLTSKNYGGILQAYALNKFLLKYTDNVELIDRRFPLTLKSRFILFVYRLCLPNYLNTINSFYRPIENFVENNFNKSYPLYRFSDSENYIMKNNFTHLITGSDQVFRMLYSKSLYRDLFLGYNINALKKVSYAASFGKDCWEDESRFLEVQKLLREFNGISVREDSGVAICADKFELSATHNIDPTFLLEKKDYLSLIYAGSEIKTHHNEKLLCTYVLDNNPEKNEIIVEVSRILDLKINRFGEKPIINRNNFKNFFNKKCDSIEDWLNAINIAEFVVTDSFHGVAFSIIFNKQFIAIGNKSRGLSRFLSILKIFNLEKRLIFIDTDHKNLKDIINDRIDYSIINSIIENEKHNSDLYLKKNLC
ncbi:Polysaccharide pyruvyl transferase [compost metagenome]